MKKNNCWWDKRLKVVLIVPENSMASKMNNIVGETENAWEFEARMRLWSCPSLSLLTVAGMMPEGSDIEYIDLNYTSEPDISADWVFFSPSTAQANRAYQLADMLRKNGIKIAMGGPHVTILPNEASQHSDVVFIGESEKTFLAFLKDLEKQKTKRIYKASNFTDITMSPTPLYHLARQHPYKSIPIQTSRGCPHQCSFCISSKIYGNKIRCKTGIQLENELFTVKEIFGKSYVFFTDDNFFINKQRNDNLISIIKNSKVNWYAFSDAKIAEDGKLLSEIANAGCTQLLIGFESLCSENLQGLNKSSWKMKKLQSYKEIINRIQSLGIGVVGSFIVGMENDTVDVFDNLYAFIEETSLYATNITVLTPFPGTKIYEKLKYERRLISKDWTAYNGFELTFKPNHMTIEEFEKGYTGLNTQLNSTERMYRVIEHFKTVFAAKKRNESNVNVKCKNV